MQVRENVVRAALALIVLSAPTVSVSAQGVQAQDTQHSYSSTSSNEGGAICMTRAKAGLAAGKTPKSREPTDIAVPEMIVPDLRKKGFKQVECDKTKLKTKGAKEAWRNEICEKAAQGNQAVQNQYTRLYGERPAALCAAAQRVSGKPPEKTSKTDKKPKTVSDAASE